MFSNKRVNREEFHQSKENNPSPKKIKRSNYLLVLDIDGNLIEASTSPDYVSDLSTSAQLALSMSGAGLISKPKIVSIDTDNHTWIHEIRAISLESWQDLFSKIYKNNQDPNNPHIHIMFLTNATYDKDLFNSNVLNKLFSLPHPENENATLLFEEIQYSYYNRKMQFQVLESTYEIGHEVYAAIFESLSLLKAVFLNSIFHLIQNELGVIDKENVIFVDDNDNNCAAASEAGYKAIHHPTIPANRPPDRRYGDVNIFLEIEKIVFSHHQQEQDLASILKPV